MNIPPNEHLIVSANSSRTVPRQIVLAAAAMVLTGTGAARAQSVPAAPPLSILPAVELTAQVNSGEVLTLEHSGTMLRWGALTEPYYGLGEAITLSGTSPNGAEAAYFRLRTDTRPEAGRARWSLEGERIALNDGGSPATLSLEPDGRGVRSGADSVQTCTWTWLRTGRDAGTLTLTWPDSRRTELEMEFLGHSSGAFVSRSPDAALDIRSGTFTLAAAAAAPAAAPVVLENVRLDFSGSGRPVSYTVSTPGTAVHSSPFARETVVMNYSRTGNTTALLQIDNGSVSQQIELTFTAAMCGTCVTREWRAGVLRRESAGSFVLTPVE